MLAQPGTHGPNDFQRKGFEGAGFPLCNVGQQFFCQQSPVNSLLSSGASFEGATCIARLKARHGSISFQIKAVLIGKRIEFGILNGQAQLAQALIHVCAEKRFNAGVPLQLM